MTDDGRAVLYFRRVWLISTTKGVLVHEGNRAELEATCAKLRLVSGTRIVSVYMLPRGTARVATPTAALSSVEDK